MGEVAGDRQCALRADEKPCRLALRILHPEYLRQRDGLVVARVVKYAQDHRIAVVVAQATGLAVPLTSLRSDL